MATELVMPQLGESVVEGTVGRWLKKEGERIEAYEPLLEVETDKVNTEVPAPASGVLLKILVPAGETVPAGTLLCLIGEPADAAALPAAATLNGRPEDGNSRAEPQVVAAGQSQKQESHVTPVVARIAAEHGVDLGRITGSGRGGRVTKKDILAYIQRRDTAVTAPAIETEPARPWDTPGSGDLFGPTEEVFARASGLAPSPHPMPTPPTAIRGEIRPLSSMRRAIAEHMVRSKQTSAHVTTVMEADCSRIWAFREQHKAEFLRREGIKLTFTPFFIMAAVAGLKAVPEANSRLSEEGLHLLPQINIGTAVAIEQGLIVPVIKQADGLNLTGLQRALTELAASARQGQLKPDDVQDGTFTVTNHGSGGTLIGTPIIHQPQVGILGVGAIQKRAVVITQGGVDSIAIKPMCYLSFSFDHRVLDGADSARFLGIVKKRIENWG
jgi:2-oxoisovalerate dehydrogenase E2 component (dihydrolipoyl transacylase)